jgi:hypothetical protein
MTRFAADAFRFDLPGDGWREESVQMFTPEGDDASAFMIGRRERAADAAQTIERALGSFPKSSVLEVELVRSEQIEVGALQGTDLGIISRAKTGADYMRLVIVPYYDEDLYLSWGGPAADRSAVDARAEHGLETMRFRRR